MRILTWNCNGGFGKKRAHLEMHCPDIAVVRKDRAVGWCLPGERGTNPVFWSSDGKSKGLAVTAGAGLAIEPVPEPFCSQKCFGAFRIRGRFQVNLLAVWAKPHSDGGQGAYPKAIAEAVSYYEPFLREGPAIVCGDFNSNIRWDTPRKPSHRRLVQQLTSLGLVSAYHAFTGECEGPERDCTLMWTTALFRMTGCSESET